MAKLKLKNVDEIDKVIVQEHQTWLADTNNVPDCLQELKTLDSTSTKSGKNISFSVLKYPKQWSGARMLETSIVVETSTDISCYPLILNHLERKKSLNKNDTKQIAALDAFKKNYQKFYNALKERCLLLAIQQTAAKLMPAANDLSEREQRLLSYFNDLSPINLLTRDDCLKQHCEIVLICNALKQSGQFKDESQLQQLEVLSKRWTDIHYEKVKKSTSLELGLNGISTVSSTLGLITGIAAASLGMAGLFFPPLLAPAAILGAISMVSYVLLVYPLIK